MSHRPVFLYAAVYEDESTAKADYEAALALHDEGLVGALDVAIIHRKDNGKVHIHRKETTTEHGGRTGLVVGALAGLIFPPSFLADAAIGGTDGAIAGHLWRGMSRSDLKEIGETLDSGESAVVIMGQDKLGEEVEKATAHAEKVLQKEIDADADEIQRELDDATA